MTETPVVRTHLEMTSRDQLKREALPPNARVERATGCTVPFFRFLYKEVGDRYHWHDRLVWTDEQCRARFTAPHIQIWVLYVDGTPAGYFEIERHMDDSVEIVYFGLMQDFVGGGYGKAMLSAAVEKSWDFDAKRVWLHTCTLDNPAALPNYLKRGFTPFKTEHYTVNFVPAVRTTNAPPPA